MTPVRRSDDDELCGHVEELDGAWRACTVFGAVLGTHDTHDAARDQVLAEGLASLAERWTLHDAADGTDEIVCILEAHDGSVTVSVGYYPEPGAPVLTLAAAELVGGRWSLRR